MEDAEWYESAQKLQRIQELLKPYKEDDSQKDSPVLQALLKAQVELDKNACVLHDIARWQRVAQTVPVNTNQEVCCVSTPK
jgi:hypothetical protein